MRASYCVPLGLVIACATAPPPPPKGGPRGLHADEHVQLAHHFDDAAKQNAQPPDSFSTHDGVNLAWVRSWDPTAENARLAEVHRSKAAELEAELQLACGERTGAEASVSPLARYGIAAWNTSTGVIMYLSLNAGEPDQLVADMKCHRAWMMLSATDAMEDCPLDLPGIKVDARGTPDLIEVSITVQDRELVDELQRRAAHDLENAAQLRRGAAR